MSYAEILERGMREGYGQAYNTYVTPGPDHDGQETCLCAIGTMYLGATDQLPTYGQGVNYRAIAEAAGYGDRIAQATDEPNKYDMYSPTVEVNGDHIPFFAALVLLNDEKHWSLDSILAWIKRVEPTFK